MKKKTRQLLIFILFTLFLIFNINVSVFANVKVGGTASVGGPINFTIFPPSDAFDNDLATQWYQITNIWGGPEENPNYTEPLPAIIIYELVSPEIATTFGIGSGSVIGDGWELSGSNDGSNWTSIHIETQSPIGNMITLNSSISYQFYKLEIDPEIDSVEKTIELWPGYSYTYTEYTSYVIITEFELYKDRCSPTGTLEGVYECDGILETDGVVESGTSAELLTNQSIILKPGFWAKAGSTFRASLEVDSDGDGMIDVWEFQYNLDHYFDDSDEDWDNDGLTNLEEFLNGTSPFNSDTDFDGMPDGWEVTNGTNPLVNDADEDLDNDGATNYEEYLAQTDPGDPYDKPTPVVYEFNYDDNGNMESMQEQQ